MADEPKEQEQSQSETEQYDAIFSEVVGGVKPEEKQPEEKTEKKEAEPSAEKKPEEEPEKKEGEEEEPSARQLADKRATELEAKEKDGRKETVTVTDKKQDAQQNKDVVEVRKVMLENLPSTYEINGQIYKTEDVLRAYGENNSDLIGIARLIAEQTAETNVKKLRDELSKQTQQDIMSLRVELEREKVMSRITSETQFDVHKLQLDDNGKPATKDGERFWGWLETQSNGYKAMARSSDPGDTIALVKAWREDEVNERNKKIDEAKAEEKKRQEDIHRHTMRRDTQTGKLSKEKEGETFEEVWEEVIGSGKK